MNIEAVDQERRPGQCSLLWSGLKRGVVDSTNKVVNTAKSMKKLGQDDPRRIIHSLKVGLALTFVSLIYYVRPLYDGYGVSGMWAVLTVIVVLEFTVGATLSRGLNRGCATLVAGAFGVGAQELASLFGEQGEPFVLGFLVFCLAAIATFTRFFPWVKARYDYGVMVFILTFSLVTISGYRVENLLGMAHKRLSTIIIGGATCIVISISICPIWAGEDLHNLITLHLEKLATSLQGFGNSYFCSSSEDVPVILKASLIEYKSVLTSKSTEESLANFARWEPGHGQFRFRHPWKQYPKIGALARECAYQIEALNGYFNSNYQVSPTFKKKFEEPCMKLISESSKALKMLALSVKLMNDLSPASLHIENSKIAVNDVMILIKTVSLFEDADLQSIASVATIASTLIQVMQCIEKISESVHTLSCLAHFKYPLKSTLSPENSQSFLHRGGVMPIMERGGDNHAVIVVDDDDDSKDEDFSESIMPVMEGGDSNRVLVVHDGESMAQDFSENESSSQKIQL